jgi:hypothetical protein
MLEETQLSRNISAFFIAICIVITALQLTGCGNSSSEDAAIPAAPMSSAPKIPSTNATAPVKMQFSQLKFETPVKTVKDKDGLVFLEFQYADRDGKVYKCNLPKAMSEGEYLPEEWARTFKLYRLPDAVKQKKIEKDQSFSDFPFIAPKLQPVNSSQTQNGETGNTTMPMPQ